MTNVVISQPMYFPWPGFFEQLMLADTYLWLDDAHFSRGSFTNRIKIGHSGQQKWMTVPLTKEAGTPLIMDLAAPNDFRAGHMAFLRQAFRQAPHATDALALAEEVFAERNLCDLLIASVEVPARWLGLPPVRSCDRTSRMGVRGRSSQRVLDLVASRGGTRYITGHGAADYLDHEAFEAAGITVEYMAYSKTAWQPAGMPEMPHLSILDLIAHRGHEATAYLRPATTGWRAFLAERDVARLKSA